MGHGRRLSQASSWPDGTISFDDRFRVEERHYFGPFYAVRVFDTATGRRVRLKNGAFLSGKSSVARAVKYGIERYLREDGD